MKSSNGAKIILAVLYLLGIPMMLWGGSLQISWKANTESDLSGYRIYYGTSTRDYTYALNVGNTTSVKVDGFIEGTTYYLALTSYDYSGNESGFSSEASVTIPARPGGSGILSTFISWVSALFGGGTVNDPELAQYNISDFSNISRLDIAQDLGVVRVGGAFSSTPTTIEPAESVDYVMKDVIAMVGEYFDFSWVYPDGTYLFLPLTENTPDIENGMFSTTGPGVYLYLVADPLGEYLHILRISALDMLYSYSDYMYGQEMYLEDAGLGISITLSPDAVEGMMPVAIGQNYSEIIEANAMALRGRDTIEFSIAPYGLVLTDPAEIRVAFNGTDAGAEYFDEKECRWKSIPDVRVEDGMAVFSTQSLGRFKVYDANPSAGSSSSGGGGGGGCFIETCR
ncbi:MAG TPA: fibronectin type III domain-containing protein [Deltaproteobacteria bacterium]|jgi:hypothetical protein|nr:fibronectin type III domain-containing protein [Deltaproteobacteria bacterium]HOI08213.1 fibronectin type III domain-containing protein [Deltaproteobacteria bacterium]